MAVEPDLSVVVTSRNDDHGGNLIGRTNCFLRALDKNAQSSGLKVEVVFVEWNPPAHTAPVQSVLEWPPASAHFQARVLTVPNSVHAGIPHGQALPLFQMIAKNVGVRRAAAQAVLATNIDIIWSAALTSHLATRPWTPGRLIRADRADVPSSIAEETDLEVIHKVAADQAFRLHGKNGVEFKGEDAGRWHTHRRRHVSRIAQWMRHILLQDRMSEILPHEPRLVRLLQGLRARNFAKRAPTLHTNACGDFTLMTKSDWYRLRGYGEWAAYSWNIDSLLLAHAHYSGIREFILPADAIVYHIEHGFGSGWSPEAEIELFDRMRKRSVPVIDDLAATRLMMSMADGQFAPNTEAWGLRDADIAESRL